MFKRAEVEIEGLTPLLMDRMDPKVLMTKITSKIETHEDLKKMAKKSRYITNIDGKEYLCVEARAVHACIIGMAKYFKSGKYRLDMLLAGNMRIEPHSDQTKEIHSGLAAMPLTKNGEPIGAEDHVVDERVVKRKVLKGRAKIWPWGLKFYLVADEGLLEEEGDTLKGIISGAGTTLGLLSYAPRNRGSFGTFKLVKFEVSDK